MAGLTGGIEYTSYNICKHCGFKMPATRTCWGKCDYEDEYIEMEYCHFCYYIHKIDIAKLYPELTEKINAKID